MPVKPNTPSGVCLPVYTWAVCAAALFLAGCDTQPKHDWPGVLASIPDPVMQRPKSLR